MQQILLDRALSALGKIACRHQAADHLAQAIKILWPIVRFEFVIRELAWSVERIGKRSISTARETLSLTPNRIDHKYGDAYNRRRKNERRPPRSHIRSFQSHPPVVVKAQAEYSVNTSTGDDEREKTEYSSFEWLQIGQTMRAHVNAREQDRGAGTDSQVLPLGQAEPLQQIAALIIEGPRNELLIEGPRNELRAKLAQVDDLHH